MYEYTYCRHCIISNDAAQDLDLPPNRLYGYDGCIAGSFIVCGDSDDGLISLTDEQMAYYEKLYHHPIAFLPMVHSFLWLGTSSVMVNSANSSLRPGNSNLAMTYAPMA